MRSIQRETFNALLILAGIFAAAMGLKGFLFSSHFIDGGVTGISMLLSQTTPLPLAVWLPVVNLPFVVLGYHQLGRAFALRSALAIIGLAVVLATVHFPDVTHDRLLTAVFGGVFIGAGIGLAMRGGAVLDGTEIAALLIGRKSPVLKVGDVILGFNVVLFVVAMSILGVEPALYSILTYVAAARTLDFILHGIEEFTAITIMSPASQGIRAAVVGEMGRGVTVYKALGGKTGEDREILYCVVTRLEIGGILRIIDRLDRDAFVVQHPLADVRGGFVHRHALP
ncbi:MAG TPA: YitT family protein [Vicinamibacterales bacterium]|nr:YitT family protein [Vicinamibacterales bacterium]